MKLKPKLSLSKRWACVLATAFMLAPTFSYANPSAAEIAQVRQMILELNSADKPTASNMAVTLSGYRYQEVAQALINVALGEFQTGHPNTYVVGNAVKSLVILATAQHVASLQQIGQQIDIYSATANPGTAKSLSYIRAEVNQAVSNAQYRADSALESLKQYEVKVADPILARQVQPPAQKIEKLKTQLEDLLSSNKADIEVKNAAKVILISVKDYLTDDIQEQTQKNQQFEVIGRDKETNQVIDTLVREKGKNPILVGPRGAGKTSIAQKVAQLIISNQIPQIPVFQEELGRAFVIETTPARISRLAQSDQDNSQAAALEQFFDAIVTLEKKANIKLVIFIDEIHTLGKGQIEAMKPYLDSRDKAVRLIGASTAVEYQNAFKSNPAIQRRFNVIGVSEQSVPEVKEIINRSIKSRVEKRYNVQLSNEAIDVVVTSALRVYPDTSRIDGSAKMLEDLATAQSRIALSKGHAGTISIGENEVYSFMQQKLGYPVNPLDVRGLQAYRQDLTETLNEQVVGQERMVSDVVGQWMMLMKNQSKGVRTIMELGPTGVGKSLLGRELAKKVFGSEGAFLEVDANQFKTGGLSTNTFFGAPNGVVSSDKTAGMLFDYLDDPGKGKWGGIILINEAERASPDFWEKMMEIMDTGHAVGSDGKERTLARHLIILTSNGADKELYPKTIEDWTSQEYKAHMQSLTEDHLKQAFMTSKTGKELSDAVLARVNKFTAAEPMTPAKVQLVALQKAKRIVKQNEDIYKIKIDLDPAVINEITASAYEKGIGARPVENKVSELLETAMDRALAQSDVARGEQIKITLAKNGSKSMIQVQTAKGMAITEIPKIQKQDLLTDDEFMAKMGNLETEMKKRLIGQDEMIGRLKDAVIAHQVSDGKRPLSMFLVGSTGNGKTESAKALAKVLYGNEGRVVVLDMGKIIYEGELNNIFGSPAGHVGSESERGFEQFLRENPQGGVIVFDEISNMGGKDPAQKEALFKKFYSIFEEGTWTSPASNKTYDLSKYTIINTGNDLEKMFQGQAADDIRMAIWQQTKSKARSLLRQAGVPEAFLGRMADVILMKPLLKTEVAQIARKMLNEQTADFKARGIDVQYSDSFVNDVANIFFTQDQGARSVRNLVEHRVKSAITQIVIKAQGMPNVKGKTVVLSVKDNMKPRTYIKTSDAAREVLLVADLMNGNVKEQSVTLDATEFASKINLQSKQEVLRTSYHEAGHAVVNNPNVTGQKVALITVVGRDQYLGYARYEDISGQRKSSTESAVVTELARLLAGGLAEKMAGFQQSEGWQNDLEKARKIASRYILDSGLGAGMASVPLDDQGRPRLSGQKAIQFQSEMDRLFKAGQELANQSLQANWNLIRSIVSELFYHGEISGQRFDQLQISLKGKYLDAWQKPEATKMVRVRCEALF